MWNICILNRSLEQLIDSMGRARLLDNLSSKRDRRRVYVPAHIIDEQIRAMIVRAIVISLAPR